MKTQLELIQEAYTGILLEGKEPKFKVGDKVGVGSFGSYVYEPMDTGTVTKVNKSGHEVTHDIRKSMDDDQKPFVSKYDPDGIGSSKSGYSLTRIIPIQDHNDLIADRKMHNERATDMNTIMAHIGSKRNGLGEYSKFDSSTAEHLKSLIDKHTDQK